MNPVFIHSLFRTGSTYMFNVFRRASSKYWCYQEPIHELVLLANNNPESLLKFTSDYLKDLRHPRIAGSYFYELYEIYPAWKDKIKKRIIYDAYFYNQNDPHLIDYLQSLIDHAKGTAVIQECRTANRIATIKKTFKGCHIYLLRNPRNQWQSYNVNSYFPLVNLLILNAEPHPEIISTLRKEINFIPYHSDNISEEFTFFSNMEITPEKSYLIFYTLWLLGLIEGYKHADILINIDALSNNLNYRKKILNMLESFNIKGLNFDDCKIPQYHLKESYEKIETRAELLMIQSGITENINTIKRQCLINWNTRR